MDNPLELLKKILGVTPELDDATVEKTWLQAGNLSPEDSLRRRKLYAETAERKREHEMYAKKMAALKAINEAEAAEWWDHIHKVYGLAEGNYHVLEDGRIFAKPKEKKNDEA